MVQSWLCIAGGGFIRGWEQTILPISKNGLPMLSASISNENYLPELPLRFFR